MVASVRVYWATLDVVGCVRHVFEPYLTDRTLHTVSATRCELLLMWLIMIAGTDLQGGDGD